MPHAAYNLNRTIKIVRSEIAPGMITPSCAFPSRPCYCHRPHKIDNLSLSSCNQQCVSALVERRIGVFTCLSSKCDSRSCNTPSVWTLTSLARANRLYQRGSHLYSRYQLMNANPVVQPDRPERLCRIISRLADACLLLLACGIKKLVRSFLIAPL
jgi:hypothetical protein